MPADRLEPGELGCTIPELYGMPINELPSPIPCCGFVRDLKVHSTLDMPLSVDDVNPKVRH